MYKEDEQWIDNIKQRLEQHSEPLPPDGWAKLEQALAAQPATATQPVTQVDTPRKGKTIVLRRLAVAAGIAVLIGLASVTFFLLPPEREAVTPLVATTTPVPAVPTVTPDEPSEEPATIIEEKRPQPQTVVRRRAGSGQYRELAVATVVEPADDKKPAAVKEEQAPERQAADTDNNKEEEQQPADNVRPKERPYRPAKHSELPILNEQPVRRNKSRGWSVGVSVGNTSSNVQNGKTYAPAAPMGQMDMPHASEGPLEINEDESVVFKNGIPYLNNGRITRLSHRLPVSVGVNVRKGLPAGFSVEAGVMYTQLVSDGVLAETSAHVTQRLHYVGIPVRANWNFVDRRRFVAYLSAGGAVEKCVYGTQGSEKITVDPLQFSVTAAVGAQLNLTKRLGVYVEPGVSHYFDDGSKVETIRKESSLNFTLQAGLRLMY